MSWAGSRDKRHPAAADGAVGLGLGGITVVRCRNGAPAAGSSIVDQDPIKPSFSIFSFYSTGYAMAPTRVRWQHLALRQAKAWIGGWDDLKPFGVTQGVRIPSGRGGARQPEASLAWSSATAIVKRRQRVLKPCDGASRCCGRRSLRFCQCGGGVGKSANGQDDRFGRGLRAGQRRGTGHQATCEIPLASAWTLTGEERRLNKAPGPTTGLTASGAPRADAGGEHEGSGARRNPKANP
jgi:hypothetical protein